LAILRRALLHAHLSPSFGMSPSSVPHGNTPDPRERREGRGAGACVRNLCTVGSDPVLKIAREVARIAVAKLRQAPITAGDELAAFRGSAGAFHALGWIAVDHRVVDRQLGSSRDVVHGDEGDLTSDPDVRSTRVVEAQDVAFDLCGGSRGNVEI